MKKEKELWYVKIMHKQQCPGGVLELGYGTFVEARSEEDARIEADERFFHHIPNTHLGYLTSDDCLSDRRNVDYRIAYSGVADTEESRLLMGERALKDLERLLLDRI